jgi:8-oxo-dGTP pyrophosphatase MutT (NUDIX family)
MELTLQRASDLLNAARRFERNRHVALYCEGRQVGWLRLHAAQKLPEWPDVFTCDAAGVRVADALTTAAARTAAIDPVIEALRAQGVITGWRNERYAVAAAFDAPPLFHIERAAARFLGTATYAAHVNGFCGSGAAGEMWVARRAASKPIEPGLLDNMIAGGLSAGTPPLEVVAKEAWEEAGVRAEIARRAVPAGTIAILREVPEGVQWETIFIHDLELARDFQPVNQDGEVAEFRRLPVTTVIAILNGAGRFTLDASLVVLSFLARRGYLNDETILSQLGEGPAVDRTAMAQSNGNG